MKKILLISMLMIVGVVSMNAQVTIGMDSDPHAGAILDLKSDDKGLLLPNVWLNNVEFLQVGELYNVDDDDSAIGMTVLNTNPSIVGGIGMYVWDGHRWRSLFECQLPAQPGEIIVTNHATIPNIYTIMVDNVPYATSYKWSIPDDRGLTVIGQDDTRHCVVMASSAKAIIYAGELTVYAMNDCGNSATTANQEFIVLTDGQPAPIGPLITNGVFNGPANKDGLWGNDLSELGVQGFSATGNDLEVSEYEYLLNTYNKADAPTACTTKLGQGWRLPNIAELVNIDESDTNIISNGSYWSSTLDESGDNAWVYTKIQGGNSGIEQGVTDGRHHVRCVRNK